MALKRKKTQFRAFGWVLVGQQMDVHSSLLWVYVVYLHSSFTTASMESLWKALDDDQTHCPSSSVVLSVTCHPSLSPSTISTFLGSSRITNSSSILLNNRYNSISNWNNQNQIQGQKGEDMSPCFQVFYQTQYTNRSPYHQFGAAWDRRECKSIPERFGSRSPMSLYAPMMCTYYPNPNAFTDVSPVPFKPDSNENNQQRNMLNQLVTGGGVKPGCGCRKNK